MQNAHKLSQPQQGYVTEYWKIVRQKRARSWNERAK